MRYLVTGAGGFIGGAVADRLIRSGNECVTIDNFSTGSRQRVPKDCTLLEGNTFDETVIEKLTSMQKFDAVIHIAGQSSGEVSFYDPLYDLQTNVQSTLLLLNFAVKTGVKKFVYAGSMSVYGDPPPDAACCTEKFPTVPKSFYAVGKLASENYMRIFAQHYGLCCTSLRFFNVYGVGQNLDNLRQGMVSIYLAQALVNHHIDVKGSLNRFRDLVYIDDAVESVIAAINRNCGMEIFNVCTQIPTKVSEMIDAIRQNLNFPVTVSVTQETPGDQFGIYGSFAKIAESLNWQPKIKFDVGIKLMTQWAAKNLSERKSFP